jgi:hypothetical protein
MTIVMLSMRLYEFVPPWVVTLADASGVVSFEGVFAKIGKKNLINFCVNNSLTSCWLLQAFRRGCRR